MLNYKLERYEKFEVDAAGRPLRYKILIYDMCVLAVLYNTGESIEKVKFHEIKVASGVDDYFIIEKGTKFDFGRLTHVPLAMLSTPQK